METKLIKLASVEEILKNTDFSTIPYYCDLKEEIDKQLTKGFTSYESLNESDEICKGDRITISIESNLKKYNKPCLKINCGNGLYDKNIEQMIIGKHIGYKDCIMINDSKVFFEVKGAERIVYPKATDEMAKYLHIEGIDSVEKYNRKVVAERQQEELEKILEGILTELRNKSEFSAISENDVFLSGKAFFDKVCARFLHGEDINTLDQKSINQIFLGARNARDYGDVIRNGSINEIMNCLILCAYYGVECTDKYDPTVSGDAEVELNRRFKRELTNRFIREEL